MLYKYLSLKYAELFVQKGQILFRSMLYFLACEDARRDELEGTHQYEPIDGLEITNKTRGSRQRVLGTSLRSSATHPDELFIFSTSQRLTVDLAAKFEADACVEITDTRPFVARLKTALRRIPRVKEKTLIHGNSSGPVECWH